MISNIDIGHTKSPISLLCCYLHNVHFFSYMKMHPKMNFESLKNGQLGPLGVRTTDNRRSRSVPGSVPAVLRRISLHSAPQHGLGS